MERLSQDAKDTATKSRHARIDLAPWARGEREAARHERKLSLK